MADPNFKFDMFPNDLSSSYYNHWMTITAYTTYGPYTGAIGNNLPGYTVNKTPAYTAVMYIPGGQGDSGIFYDDEHEFTDVKLTNMATQAIAGVTSGIPFVGDLISSAVQKAPTMASMAGKPINPGIEVIYATTKRRSFNFTFLMAPSSEDESNKMKNIIKNLRMYAAPELIGVTNGSVMRAPAEFAIKFFHKNGENENIPKIRRCVLDRVTVNYSPNGEWSTFSNGHPVSCMLMLNFQELEFIHRDLVSQGF